MSRAAKVLPIVTVGVVAIAALSGLVLVWWYRPDGAWTEGGSGSGALVSVHGLSMQAAVTLALVTAVVLGVARRPLMRVVAAGVVVVSSVVAAATWGLVVWDQIAVEAVVVGSDVRGLWLAAFDEGVAFLLVDGAEVGQETYRRWLLVHLASLAVMVVASLAAVWPDRDAPSTGEVERDADGIPIFDLQ